MNTKLFLVSADHVVERHACRDLEFRVGEYRDGDRVSYYASAPGFGCSKNYRTPEDAIRGMLLEHACTNVRIRAVEEDDRQKAFDNALEEHDRQFGKKGGAGPTAGQSVAIYEGTLPDGRVVRKSSFRVSADEAFLAIYRAETDDTWRVASVVAKVTEDGRPIFRSGAVGEHPAVPARRVK